MKMEFEGEDGEATMVKMVILDDDEEASMGEFVLGFLERDNERKRRKSVLMIWCASRREAHSRGAKALLTTQSITRRTFCG